MSAAGDELRLHANALRALAEEARKVLPPQHCLHRNPVKGEHVAIHALATAVASTAEALDKTAAAIDQLVRR